MYTHTHHRQRFNELHPPGIDDEKVPIFYGKLIDKFQIREQKSEKKIAFIVVAHFVHTLPYFLEALSAIGDVAALISKQSGTVKKVKKSLLEIYQHIIFSDVNKENLHQDSNVATKFFEKLFAQEQWQNHRFIILDHGGYFAPRLQDILCGFHDKIIGIVEHTWNGEIRYKKQLAVNSKFPFPILSIAHSSLKGLESEAVAQSIIDALSTKMGGEGLNQSIYRLNCILVLGYGNIGKEVALALKRRLGHRGNNVIHICDISEDMLQDAHRYFPSQNITTDKNKFLKQADLIITATSSQVLLREDFSKLKHKAIIACATSSDDQFGEHALADYEPWEPDETIKKPKLSCVEYRHKGHTDQKLYLVANGDSVNFSIGSTSNPIIHLILGSICIMTNELIINSSSNLWLLDQVELSNIKNEEIIKDMYESIFGSLKTSEEEKKNTSDLSLNKFRLPWDTSYFNFINKIDLKTCPLTTTEASLIADVMSLSSKPFKSVFKAFLNSLVPILEKNPSPTCFISYAWVNEEIHPEEYWTQEFLDRLANWLRYVGIEVTVDKDHCRFGESMSAFSEKNIANANFVILAGTKTFLAKLYSANASNVKHEYQCISDRISLDKKKSQATNSTFGSVIPIIISGKPAQSLPSELFGEIAIEDFSGNNSMSDISFIENFQKLLTRICAITLLHPHYETYNKLWDKFRENWVLPYGNRKGSLVKNPWLFFQQINVRQENFGKRKARILSGLPENKGKLYIGRTKEFEAIQSSIKCNLKPERTQTTVISGMGGSGKTTFAEKIIFSVKSLVKTCIWINVDLKISDYPYEAYIKQLGLNVGDVNKQEQQNLFFDWLRDNPGWVIVLDDVADYVSIEAFLPKQGGHVIITSRSSAWPLNTTDKYFMTYHLSDLTLEESKQLINRITRKDFNKQQTDFLANTLGHLPLALEQASAYIESEGTIEGYIRQFNESPAEMSEYSEHKNVYQTLTLSLDKIKEICLASIELLHQCSLFGSGFVPKILLCRFTKTREITLTKNLKPIISYYLIENNDNILRLHPVVAQILFDKLPDLQKIELIEKGLGFIESSFKEKELKDKYAINLIGFMLELNLKINNLQKKDIKINPILCANAYIALMPILFTNDNMFALKQLDQLWKILLTNEEIKNDVDLHLKLITNYLSYCTKKRKGFKFLKPFFHELDENRFSKEDKAEILLLKGIIELELGKFLSAAKFLEAAIQTGHLTVVRLAKAHANRITAYTQMKPIPINIQVIEKEAFDVLNLLPDSDDTITVITYVRGNLAVFYKEEDNLDYAEQLLMQNMEDVKKIKSRVPNRGLSWIYYSLSDISCLRGNLADAETKYQLFVEYMNKVFGDLLHWPKAYQETHEKLWQKIQNLQGSIHTVGFCR